MNTILKRILSILLPASATLAFAFSAYAATTVVITGNTAAGENQPGWLFNRDVKTATPYEFNADAASIGDGSLYVQPIANDYDGSLGTCKGGVDQTGCNKFIAENFLNTAIADVNSISYDFQIGSGGTATDEEQFYMSVYANFGVSDDDKFYDCRYAVIPTTGSTAGFTTVTFDPTQPYPVATRTGAEASPFSCPAIPADMDTLSPGSNIRAFSLNVGDTSSSDTGLDGYLDNVVVDLDSEVTTYDFEPATTPVSKDECKNGGWITFNSPTFKNQGACVSYLQSNENAGKRN